LVHAYLLPLLCFLFQVYYQQKNYFWSKQLNLLIMLQILDHAKLFEIRNEYAIGKIFSSLEFVKEGAYVMLDFFISI
jgi:hypothetical protein